MVHACMKLDFLGQLSNGLRIAEWDLARMSHELSTATVTPIHDIFGLGKADDGIHFNSLEQSK